MSKSDTRKKVFVRFLCERPRRGPERPVYTQLCSHAWGERGGHISRRREARWGPRTSSTYGRRSCTCSACAFFSPFFFTFAVLLLALRSSQAVGICGRYRGKRMAAFPAAYTYAWRTIVGATGELQSQTVGGGGRRALCCVRQQRWACRAGPRGYFRRGEGHELGRPAHSTHRAPPPLRLTPATIQRACAVTVELINDPTPRTGIFGGVSNASGKGGFAGFVIYELQPPVTVSCPPAAGRTRRCTWQPHVRRCT